MRILLVSLFLSVCTFGADIIHLKRGDSAEGEIMVIDDEKLTLQIRHELSPGNFGSRTVNVPLNLIEYIEFEPSENEAEILADPAAADLAALSALWDEKRKHLQRPRSNSGTVALAYADKILATSDDEIRAAQAKELFEKVESQDWNEDNKRLATQGRLRAMIAMGEMKAAISEAEKMAEETEDPKILIEAKFVLASAEFTQLKAIEEEHPRWMEDDDVKPIREKHYNAALDLYLFAYLFYGSEQEASARGLWGATEVYRFAKNESSARHCAEDILKLYPNTTFKPRAKQFLSTIETP